MIRIKAKKFKDKTGTVIIAKGKGSDIVREAVAIYRGLPESLKKNDPETYETFMEAIRVLEEKEAVEDAIRKEEGKDE